MSRDLVRPRRRSLILAGAIISLIPFVAAAPAEALILPLPSLPPASTQPTVRPLDPVPTIGPLPTIGPAPTIAPLPSLVPIGQLRIMR